MLLLKMILIFVRATTWVATIKVNMTMTADNHVVVENDLDLCQGHHLGSKQ
jgi:hypothetical protein